MHPFGGSKKKQAARCNPRRKQPYMFRRIGEVKIGLLFSFRKFHQDIVFEAVNTEWPASRNMENFFSSDSIPGPVRSQNKIRIHIEVSRCFGSNANEAPEVFL